MSVKNLLKKITVWDKAAAKHILSRTLYGYKREDIDYALSYSLDHFVDEILLAELPTPQPPGDWVNEEPSPNDDPELYKERMQELIFWQIDLMRENQINFRERMVTFWSNNFVSEAEKVKVPQYMYMQNALFRKYAFGNLIDFTKDVTIDPAMLIYLDGVKNRKNNPNENYARELLELFTIGIGNYNEEDIHNGAKALTGWKVYGLRSIFIKRLFNNDWKKFLGEEGNFNYEDIIDIIFTKNENAENFCRKLYDEFIYYKPNEEFVKELSEILIENNYEVKPALSALLKSQYFHSEEIRAAKIKSPIEMLIAGVKMLDIQDASDKFIRRSSSLLQQRLFNPPDVRGWMGQRDWISTATLPLRNTINEAMVTGEIYTGFNLAFKMDVLTFARSFDSSEDAEKFVEDVADYLFEFPLSEQKKIEMLEVLLDGSDISEWSTYNPEAESRLRGFFSAMLRLPEYQLS